jgi:RNA polymerase Rpb1, domain 5.
LSSWEISLNLKDLYIEFAQPASKTLDWLDEHNFEYLVDEETLCVYKPDVDGTTNDGDSSSPTPSAAPLKASLYEALYQYFREHSLKYEEQEEYFTLDSNYIAINISAIETLLEDITLTGTKGVASVKLIKNEDEYCIEVTGTDLDPLFENEYIDPTRSYYISYDESMDIPFEQRKQNILHQLKGIVDEGGADYNYQHVELLTNFMCRDNYIIPMSRFGMNSADYSFISQLSFEDPYHVLLDVFYGVEDNLSSVSSKLITGISDCDSNSN